jgi:hypothetical protein
MVAESVGLYKFKSYDEPYEQNPPRFSTSVRLFLFDIPNVSGISVRKVGLLETQVAVVFKLDEPLPRQMSKATQRITTHLSRLQEALTETGQRKTRARSHVPQDSQKLLYAIRALDASAC